MIQSMTGYGSKRLGNKDYTVFVEIKSLNSKYPDLHFRLPRILSEKEIEIRNIITRKLIRGKISLFLEIEVLSQEMSKIKINGPLLKMYYTELKRVADELQAGKEDIFRIASMQPDAIPGMDHTPENLWELVEKCVKSAIESCVEYRNKEGAELAAYLEGFVLNISQYLDNIRIMEKDRIPRIKERILTSIRQLNFDDENPDESRLEQELIYYSEKLDITEEIDRLGAHLKYFLEIMNMEGESGKKLGFVAQEIGREINTIGAKAYDAAIQREVVMMKEELEKIKEQIMNIL